jgi:hypothetical protein
VEEGHSLPELQRNVCLWPQHTTGEGHFIALLRKNKSCMASPIPPAGKYTPAASSKAACLVNTIPRLLQKAFEDFYQANLSGDVAGRFNSEARLALVGTYLYQLPSELPDLNGLSIIHPGWWLGSFKVGQGHKKSRFEPSHALAMDLQASDCRQSITFGPDDPEVYLPTRRNAARPGRG